MRKTFFACLTFCFLFSVAKGQWLVNQSGINWNETPNPSVSIPVTAPGWVMINYSGQLEEYGIYSTQNEMAYNYSLYDTGMAAEFDVSAPDGSHAASLLVTQGGSTCPIVVSGNASQITFSSTCDSGANGNNTNYPTLSCTAGGVGVKANTPFTVTAQSSTGVTSFPVVGSFSTSGSENANDGLNFENNFSGVFTFYAAMAGTYTITSYWDSYWTYEQDTLEEEQTGHDDSALGSTFGMNVGSFTTNSAVIAPAGSISVSKGEGGAGGVNITWTITPPPQ